MIRLLPLLAAACLLSSCLAGMAVGGAVGAAAGAVVGAGSAVVGAGVDVVTPGDDDDKD